MSYVIIVIILLVGVGYYYYKKGRLRIPRFKQESAEETIARLKEESDLLEHKHVELTKLRDAKMEVVNKRKANAKLKDEINKIGVQR